MRKLPFDPYSALNQKLIAGLIFGVSFWLAYQALFEGRIPPAAALQMWVLAPAVVLGQIAMNTLFRTYRSIWRYVGLGDAIVLARNFSAFPLVLVLLHYVAPHTTLFGIPLGVIAFEYLLSLLGALAVRAIRRLFYERISERALGGRRVTPVLLIGAGRVGAKTANDARAQMGLRTVGFLDDDPKKIGSVIGGLRVLGPVSSLSSVVQKHGIEQVLVCIARPAREVPRRIW